MLRHLPHVLSGARIPASLALVALYDPNSAARGSLCLTLILLIIASDVLDGRIARKYGFQSKFGYMLDGLGDRAFHVASVLLLALPGILALPLAWLLIFREISQYAVRIVEADWHSNQSTLDRAITRFYATVVQSALFIEVIRMLIRPSVPSWSYVMAINIVLFVAAMLSFSRIFPRLLRAW